MSDGYERGGRRRAGRGGRPPFDEDDDLDRDEAIDDDEEDDLPPRSRPRRRAAPAPAGRARGGRPGRPAPRKEKRSLWSLISGRPAERKVRKRQRYDWDEVDEDSDEEAYDERPRRGRREPREEGSRRKRLTLTDLATPVFGYAAILPRDVMGVHPGYQQFRNDVLAALSRIENEGPEHGIEREDARAAVYGLALFVDEQVADSEWSGKSQWAMEPLNVVLLNDPQGGINFFARLDGFGDRQRAVKEIYLTCLAFGFRGQYAELDPAQQVERIGEIRRRIVRGIHPQPLDQQDVLFPEAYEPATPVEDPVPPPPRWWIVASLAIVVVSLALYLVLYSSAGHFKDEPRKAVKQARALEGGSR